MTKIIFYTEQAWAFGQIHHSLCKLLYSHGITAEVLDFYTQYTNHEMQSMQSHVDYFVTTPVGVGWLLNYGIRPDKIKSVAHAQWDLLLSRSQIGTDIYSDLAAYGVVSQTLKQKSAEFQIPRTPDVVHLGVEFDRYYAKPADKLHTVGFAGAFEARNFAGDEIKRGRLVRQVCAQLSLPMIVPKMHYLAMPAFYRSVDCVIMASTEEGAGLPMMEAAAAGRLTMGTPVGYYGETLHEQGIALPIEENNFVQQCVAQITKYSQDPKLLAITCAANQQYAWDHWDWHNHIESWVEFLTK